MNAQAGAWTGGIARWETFMEALPAASIPACVFDGAALPAHDVFDAWRALLHPVFDTQPLADDPAPFQASVSAWHPGPLVVSKVAASGQHFHRTAATIARGGVDHYLVQLYVRGGYAGDVEGRPIRVAPGDISILDLARCLHTRAGAFECISLLVPRAALASRLPHPDAVHGSVIRGTSGGGVILGDHLRSLLRGLPLAGPAESGLLEGTVALIAACLGAVETEAVPRGRGVLSLRIRRHVEENLASGGLDVRETCERFGVSRATLQRMFEADGGYGRYVQQRRLQRAFREIVKGTPLRIGELAYASGFQNESAFSRAFRRRFGLSPRDARAGGVPAGGVPAAEHGPVQVFTDWIRTLSAA